MELEWNEDKRLSNLEKHGVDFLDAALIFEGITHSTPDRRNDYGEIRFRTIGYADGICFVVIHTQRNGVTRLISAWKGSKRDRTTYEASDT
ncbi:MULTISPECIES: BrnT family toxin [unclassified Devosia]|uniref:BrnT family toxin n=1 Tax=unclassified Devosia TaxID=196773 RepID=UPI00145E5233|nr:MULTISPECIES: BrnT family toxin [unclassified Devosia]MBJ7578359.1 BrnT family toxin [Devosia sp. MC532]